jgi:MazG family protein
MPSAIHAPALSVEAAPTALLAFARLLQVVATLRHPTQGCPWDLKQTHATLKRYLLEETQEVLTAIDDQDPAALCDELGDVLLQVALHAQIATDEQTFTMADVCHGLANKLVRRHPHVFAHNADPTGAITTPEAVTQQWQTLKQAEKTSAPPDEPASVLAPVPKGLPALSRAQNTSKRAVDVGFEWPDLPSLWACVMSEFDEFKQVMETPELPKAVKADRLEDEFGDILFACVNLGRTMGVDAETALHRATDKFTRRFNCMEQLAQVKTTPLSQLSFEQWDALWRQAKTHTQQ